MGSFSSNENNIDKSLSRENEEKDIDEYYNDDYKDEGNIISISLTNLHEDKGYNMEDLIYISSLSSISNTKINIILIESLKILYINLQIIRLIYKFLLLEKQR